MVVFETTEGLIKIECDKENTPKTTENFLRYVREGFYDGTIFHRVIDGFMVQGGGFDKNMQKKDTHAPIDNEADKGGDNLCGTIAMARTMDPHSATAQFFINVADNAFLNHSEPSPQGWGSCVFGKVVDGMDIVNQIKSVKTGSKDGHQDVPVEPIAIVKAYVEGE